MNEFEYIIKGLVAEIKEYIDKSTEPRGEHDRLITLKNCNVIQWGSVVKVVDLHKDRDYYAAIQVENTGNLLGHATICLSTAHLDYSNLPILIKIVDVLKYMEEMSDDRSE